MNADQIAPLMQVLRRIAEAIEGVAEELADLNDVFDEDAP